MLHNFHTRDLTTIHSTFLFLQMYADDVVKMRSLLIPFQVRVKWSEEEGQPLKELSYDTVIIGAKRHRIRVVSPDECISKLLPVVVGEQE